VTNTVTDVEQTALHKWSWLKKMATLGVSYNILQHKSLTSESTLVLVSKADSTDFIFAQVYS